MTDLVERDAALSTLRERLRAADERGHLVLVSGEAGIGKSSLLRALAGEHSGVVWWGGCDALQTPHPLAPLLDIAREADVRFAARLDGPRQALFEAVLDELRGADGARLVVIEDLHWADDATLDLVKFLGRRIGHARALLVASFRDDELAASHPLRRMLGELPREASTRIQLPRLSADGVAALARRALRAPAGLHAATQGNPFFLSELLRHPPDCLPASVQDLVLARFGRLAPSAQAVVRLAAIVPGRVERWLLDAVTRPSPGDLEACLDSGLLVADGAALGFRHELAREAVERAFAPVLAQALHAGVLEVLAARGHGVSSSRLAHHAALAGDREAVLRHAPLAGGEAIARGAWREAVRHYANALACAQASPEPPAALDDWREAHAQACQHTDRHAEAIASREQLALVHTAAGDPAREAGNLCALARLYVQMGRNAEGDAASRRAIGLLEGLPPGPALAAAFGTEAALRMLDRDCEESMAWSRRAIVLATELDDRPRLAASASTLGTAMMYVDYEAGCLQMESAISMALAEAVPLTAVNAMLNLGSASGELMRLDRAEPWLRRAIALAAEHEDDYSVHYATAWLALCDLARGRWADAAEHAADIAGRPGASAIARVMALLALGRLRTRRGDPGAAAVLDEALAIAGASSTLQRIAPVRAARAEAAFERGDLAAVDAEARAALALARRQRHPWFIGELAWWCWRAGTLKAAPPDCAEPYALQIAGRWREAAAAWARLGCPYEQARALAGGGAAACREALARFEHLGARPAAQALRRQLDDAGEPSAARGPRPATSARAYGLTTRELQVVQLLCEGLRNAEIARRLSRSVRTVDHHVAAVLAKLGVDSRVGAVQAAQRAGLVARAGPPSPK